MGFRYRLDSILRLRRSLERQAEQLLFMIAGQVIRLRAELEQLDRLELETKRASLQEAAAGTSGATLQFEELCLLATTEKRKALHMQMAEVERQRLEQLAVYLQARQKREILEGLHDRQKMAYHQDAARREQQATDESFLLRNFFDQQN